MYVEFVVGDLVYVFPVRCYGIVCGVNIYPNADRSFYACIMFYRTGFKHEPWIEPYVFRAIATFAGPLRAP